MPASRVSRTARAGRVDDADFGGAEDVMTCASCGGHEAIDAVMLSTIGDHGAVHPVRLVTYKKPSALLFKGRVEIPVSTWVCGGCGHVQLFVADLAALKTEMSNES
jgi:L-rhamnose isomerase